MAQKTILYVDDEEDNRLLVSTCLELEGYRVLTAENVARALKIAFSEFPDLIITDVMMPDESGYSLCKKIKDDPSTKNIPVIFLTVMEDEATAMKAGGTAFLSKPFEEEQLRATVNGILKAPDSRALLDAALEKLRANRLDEAMSGFEEVRRVDSGSAAAEWAQYYGAQILQVQGKMDRAAEELRNILVKNPSFWRAHNRLAIYYEHAQDYARAIQHYNRSLALNQTQPDIKQRLDALQKYQGHTP